MSTLPVLFESPHDAPPSSLRVFPIFEHTREHPKLSGDLALEAARVRFDAKISQDAWVQTAIGAFSGVVGAGDGNTPAGFRRVAYHAIARARALRAHTLEITLDASVRQEQAQDLVIGAVLSTWDFDTHKKERSEEEKTGELQQVVIHAPGNVRAALERGRTLADAVVFARELANQEPKTCTPRWLAEQARIRAKQLGVDVRILDEDLLLDQGFGLHLAVSRGSEEPPRLFHGIYTPDDGEITRTIALVGKGVTFDAGGYCIKTSPGMLDMHIDMGGGAAVLGAMAAIGQLKPPGVQVHFIVPMAENLISGDAYKVGEIVRGFSGASVEVQNTDAEGRLLLADALGYALSHHVDSIIDCATLTGAAVMALGDETGALFSNRDGLREAVLRSANAAGELLWPLPLVERMDDQLNSQVADLRNIGDRSGGAITAALFLQRFVEDTPWAHIDLAGPAIANKPWEYICAGGTGYGVLLLTRYLEHLAGVDA